MGNGGYYPILCVSFECDCRRKVLKENHGAIKYKESRLYFVRRAHSILKRGNYFYYPIFLNFCLFCHAFSHVSAVNITTILGHFLLQQHPYHSTCFHFYLSYGKIFCSIRSFFVVARIAFLNPFLLNWHVAMVLR